MSIKILKKTLLIAILFFTTYSFAQTTFSKRIHYGVDDNASQHLMLYNDTFYLSTWVGVQNQFEPSPWKTSLLRVDLNGNTIQPQTYYQPTDSTSITSGLSLYKSLSNKFYSAATISHWNKNDVLSGMVIFDKNGDTLVVKTYGDTTYWSSIEWIMKKTNESNRLLLFGVSDSACPAGKGNGTCRITIRTVDSLGNSLGIKYYTPGTHINKFIYFQNADTTSDKGYIISGLEPESPNYGENILLKVDSNLNEVWFRAYNVSTSLPNSVYSLKHGGYVQTYANTDSIFQGWAYFSRLAMQKVDDNGDVIWNKEYGSLERNVALTNVKELPNGDLIACGLIDVAIGNSNYPKQLYGVLLKTDSLGNEKWFQVYKGVDISDIVGESYLYDVIAMSDGGFTAAGWVVTTDTSAQLTWILRVDSNGCLMPGCIPYSSGIKQLTTGNEQLLVYPNPASTILNISFGSIGVENYTIYDILGNEITKNNRFKIQNGSGQIDISSLLTGVYFIRVGNLVQKFMKQ